MIRIATAGDHVDDKYRLLQQHAGLGPLTGTVDNSTAMDIKPVFWEKDQHFLFESSLKAWMSTTASLRKAKSKRQRNGSPRLAGAGREGRKLDGITGGPEMQIH